MITLSDYLKACDYEFDADWKLRKLDLSQIPEGARLFVRRYFLETFLKDYFPKLLRPVTIVIGYGAFSIDERHRPFLDAPNLKSCFAVHATIKHDKLTALPLGWPDYNRALMPKEPSTRYFDEKAIPIYCNWTQSYHPQRAELGKVFKVWPKKVFREYIEELKSAEFVICPQGHTPDCNRVWEALWLGTIPVVQDHGISAMYEDLPVIMVEDLSKTTYEQLCRERELLKLSKLDSSRLYAQHYINKIKGTK